jgi:hypothetical protein
LYLNVAMTKHTRIATIGLASICLTGGLFGERYNTHYFGKAKNGQEKYLLIAWKNIGRCWILVRSSQHSDGGEPSFSDAWAIFESLTVTKESNCET